MDKPISVGDLVMVVKPTLCCGYGKSVGKIFKVRRLTRTTNPVCCRVQRHAVGAIDGDGYGYQLARLKRIPPLSELETTRTEDEVTA